MTKLEIVKLAKQTKDQAKVAAEIKASYATFEGLSDEAACREFGNHMLDKDTRSAFYKSLKL